MAELYIPDEAIRALLDIVPNAAGGYYENRDEAADHARRIAAPVVGAYLRHLAAFVEVYPPHHIDAAGLRRRVADLTGDETDG